jgi:hypothetical protein
MLLDRERPRPALLAGSVLAATVLANVAFAGLGAVFDYPDVLGRPPGEVLAAFAARPLLIGGLFLLLATASALLGPIAVLLGRHARSARPVVLLGVAAAVVQAAGLLRWPLLVPFLADAATGPDGARVTRLFETANLLLGRVVGESLGYALTAAWTIAVLRAVPAGRPLRVTGVLSATLVAAGLLEPLGVPGAGAANFAGYLLWTVWLAVLTVRIWKQLPRPNTPSGVESSARSPHDS